MREPGWADVALAGLGLVAVAAWALLGFVDRDGDARLALSIVLVGLGVVLLARGLVRARRGVHDGLWVGALAFVLCGVGGLADRADAGAWGSVAGWLAFGCGMALVLRWRPPRAS
jgi:hypothetical protein